MCFLALLSNLIWTTLICFVKRGQQMEENRTGQGVEWYMANMHAEKRWLILCQCYDCLSKVLGSHVWVEYTQIVKRQTTINLDVEKCRTWVLPPGLVATLQLIFQLILLL